MGRCGRRWGTPGSRACRRASRSSGWSRRPLPCTSAWVAQATQRALSIRLRAIEATGAHHAEVAERVVVLDGVVRVEPPQRRRDVARHVPPGTRVAREPQAAPHTNHVRVERDDQLGGRYARPDAEIERVAPHHPSKKQVEALAAASRGGARGKITHAWPSG